MELNNLLEIKALINKLHSEAEKAPIFKLIKTLMRDKNTPARPLQGTYDVVLWVEDRIKYLTPRPAPPKAVAPPPPTIRPVSSPRPALETMSGEEVFDFIMNDDPSRVPIGPVLKEIHDSDYRFGDRPNPEELIAFCSRYDGKWNKYEDELSEGQLGMYRLIRMSYENDRKRRGLPIKYHRL